jgi:O-methyltransferase domain/Dimerisation domain
MNPEIASSQNSLLQIATGFWASRALYVAAKLNIADRLSNGPQSAAALALTTDAHPASLHRVLRALASLGIFEEDDSGRFRHTDLSRGLCTGPHSLREFVVMLGEAESWRSWGEVEYSVRTGAPAFEKVFGISQFNYLAEHPEVARNFDAAMAERSGAENEAVLAAWTFPSTGTVIDVGAGRASLLSVILRSQPQLQGVLFDLPHVVERARPMIEAPGIAPRMRGVAGDFFADGLPPNAQLYLLKKVIHDWDDARAASILKACARAMSADATLLLIEPVIPPGNQPSFAKLLDLFMLVWPGGRERTEAEHASLLAAAGLELRRSVPTASALTILEATRSS